MEQRQAEIEFSRRFALADLGHEGAVLEVAAEADERAALACRFGLLALDSLAATVRIGRVGGAMVRVGASYVADAVQSCIVTLEPVAARIEDSVEVLFAPPRPTVEGEVTVNALDDDDAEPLTGDTIDVGEVVAAHLGLAFDPYPRRSGVVFGGVQSKPEDEDSGASPFEALQDLVPKA